MAQLRLVIVMAGTLVLAGCGSGENVRLARADAGEALDQANAAHSLAEEAKSDVEDLSSRVDALESRVDDLESQQD